MKIPVAILESESVIEYIKSRQLIKQYQKTKMLILGGMDGGSSFKERQPKGNNIRYFRINKQYRALGSFDTDGKLRIFRIDDHQ